MEIVEKLSETFASGYDVSYNSLVLLDSTHFAVAYRVNSALNGWETQVSTFSFDDTTYSITLIDTIILVSEKTNLSFIKLSTNTLVLSSYTEEQNTALEYSEIAVFSLSSYILSLDETYIHSYDCSKYNSLVRIDDYKFILAYGKVRANNRGWIKTFEYNYGAKEISVIDYLEYGYSFNAGGSLVQIDSTHYLLAVNMIYSVPAPAEYGRLKVFSIDVNADNITEVSTISYIVDDWEDENVLCDAGSDITFYRFTLVHYDKIRVVSVNKSNYDIFITDGTSIFNSSTIGTSLIRYNDYYYIVARKTGLGYGRITIFKRDNLIFEVVQEISHHIAIMNYNSLAKVSSTTLLLSFSNYYPTSPLTGYNKIFKIIENNQIVMII